MPVQLITPADETHWLSLRAPVITSTDVSALFNLSPYVTAFELFHYHRNGIELPFVTTPRIEKGRRMETFAAQEICLNEGWGGQPFKDFAIDAGRRIGSSFDWMVNTPEPALLEIKGVDFFQHRKKWVEDQPPEHIQLQALWQMYLSGIHKCYVGAFTGLYDYKLYPVEYDQEVVDIMLAKVAEFWANVEANIAPDPDFSRDYDVISALYKGAEGEPLDKTGDDEFEALIASYERWKSAEKQAKSEADKAKAEIHFRLAEATGAYTDRYKITAKYTKGSADRIAEPGEVIKGRAGFRQCLVKDINEEGTKP